MSELSIRNVCIIGAGTEGGGIAAHLINLGFVVTLLDVTQSATLEGWDKTRQIVPSPFYIPERANEVRLGNLQDHLNWVGQADWVIEAIPENLSDKRKLYTKISPFLKPTALLTSATRGLSIGELSVEMNPDLRSRFLGTRFFRHIRFTKAIELAPSNSIEPAFVSRVTRFLEVCVGRRVIVAKDTPGFIASRLAMWSLIRATRTAEHLRLDIEVVDAITGHFLGRPDTATFRLIDITGLDVIRDVCNHIDERVGTAEKPSGFALPPSFEALINRGRLGDKVWQGYYRKEGKEFLTLDLQTYAYRQPREELPTSLTQHASLPLAERILTTLKAKDEAGEFLREYLIPFLRYADSIRGDIATSIDDIDHVFRWGFGWEAGPFELIDMLGHDLVGVSGPAFYRPNGVRHVIGSGYSSTLPSVEYLSLEECKVTEEGETYRLRDLGDGVTAIALTEKRGLIRTKTVLELKHIIESKPSARFVLTSEGECFSAGYDLREIQQAIHEGKLQELAESMITLQKLQERLEESGSVAAVFGNCLGSGLELALSCTTIVADAESIIGFPESRVGLISTGRGAALMRAYGQVSAKRLTEVALTLAEGTVSTSADMARVLGFLRPSDITIYNRDRLLSVAKHLALSSTRLTRPDWKPVGGPLVGMIDREIATRMNGGKFTDHDEMIANKIKNLIAKSTSYADALNRERSEFIDLCGKSLTQTRIRHFLDTGKHLRN